MLFLYHIIIFTVTIFSPIIIIYRILKNKEDKKRYREKFSITSKKRAKGKLIWFHGASVGEILSIVPLIKNYEKNKSIAQILVTSSTLSSSKVLQKFKFKKTVHQFFPIDNLFLTNKFLRFWKPCMAVFVESEIWPCMYNNIRERKIPLILLNARLTKKTFKRWMMLRSFARSIFNKITITYPQNLETAQYLKILKANKISHLGNLKFAENFEETFDKINIHLNKELTKKKVWVASSTHKNEELFCAKAHTQLRKKVKNLITIIIPRHIHRSKDIISEIENLGLKVSIHSSKPRNLKKTDIYIVDTFGETKKFHKISCSVFLGGSIIDRGGQNPLEAARFGAKILHGPNTDNFQDVYKLLKSLNISKKIQTPKKLASSITFRKNKIIGNKIKNIGQKILKKTIKELDYFIIDEFKKT
ncbi:3-deoxy-D-manno-octulosonic acid transferase [Candidatus Pelagibacter sp.]|nr:3-deoxy-D-manno-octulosonic acid transferase [Candidatus Pelagibacter sp.]